MTSRLAVVCILALLVGARTAAQPGPEAAGTGNAIEGSAGSNIPDDQGPADGQGPPTAPEWRAGQVEVAFGENGLTVSCLNADAHEVFARIGVATGLRIMVNDTVRDRITAHLVNMAPRDAVGKIAATYGLSHADVNGVLMISEGIPTGPASYLASEIATIPARYVPAARVKSLMPTFLQYHIKTNAEQNAVVLSAPSDVLGKFREDIGQLDIPAKQIMIEVLMVELTRSAVRDLSSDLHWSNSGDELTSSSAGGSLIYHGVTWLPTGFSARISALASEARAKIRACPRIATVSGQRAEIFIGTEQFLSKTVRRLGQTGSGQDETSISAGVRLRLRPYSGTGDIIIVNIEQAEISTLSAPDPVTGLPNRTSRSAETSVRVSDGQTIVLGGLIQTEQREDEGGIPVLRDLPVIGKLFTTHKRDSIETELVIFITPRVLSQTGHLPSEEESELGRRFGVGLGQEPSASALDQPPRRPTSVESE